jgi:DNA-binding beta-propeller fold protein YncE
MWINRLSIASALLGLVASASAAPLLQTERFPVGPVPMALAVDPASGKVIIGSASLGRGGAGAVAVLDRSGKLGSLAIASNATHVALHPTLRKAIALQSWQNLATIIDIDTLQGVTVPTGNNPTKSVIVESTGLAYVVGKTMEMSMAGGGFSATSNGFVTVIDLRSHSSHVYPMPGFAPDDLAVSPDGKRLYVVGSHYFRTGEEKVGFIQAFDTATRSAIGAPVRLGRIPRSVLVSARGDQVYVTGHADYHRGELAAQDMRRNGIRPALFVLDAATLALDNTILLPDTTNINLLGQSIPGQSALDPATGEVYVLDSWNARLTAVNPRSGTQRTTEFEAAALSFALNPVAATAVVTMNTIGQAAIVSRSGARLDTVPIGRAPAASETLTGYAAAADGATGDVYVTNGHDQSISVLRRAEEPAAVVNLTDVWFDANDPGWGLFVDQQGIVLFASLFTHDAKGEPTWLAMSNGLRQPDGSFSGILYRTRGPAPQALGDISPVGIMRLTPAAGGAMKLLYVVDGNSHTRVLQRFQFDAAARTCGWGVGNAKSLPGASNFTALWSDPREPGWGVAISQQGRTAFGVLFHYDAQNRPSWSVMSNGQQRAPGLFSGELFRASRGRIEPVGTLSLDFSRGDAGSIAYQVDGTTYRSAITRHAMTPLMTRCTP